jgi:hypothetical protein
LPNWLGWDGILVFNLAIHPAIHLSIFHAKYIERLSQKRPWGKIQRFSPWAIQKHLIKSVSVIETILNGSNQPPRRLESSHPSGGNEAFM